nr:PaaX family transcriptional regulator C-terminal domain-containing protein [Pontiella sulfatireligans]
MGCLQKSVWITPRDIRPDYDDLDRAAAVDSVAFLLEARTVLGYGNQSLVQEAWNFDHINEVQRLYVAFISENLARLSSTKATPEELMQLLRMEHQAFAQAMSIDPLLPEELLPSDYIGQRAYALHQECLEHVAGQL